VKSFSDERGYEAPTWRQRPSFFREFGKIDPAFAREQMLSARHHDDGSW
jgi:hypothetical protein